VAEMKYIKHNDIDKMLWDKCIDNTEDAQVYGYSWYLDAVCDEKWDGIIIGDYEAVFPLPYKRKFGILMIYQPFFCQQLGLFSQIESNYLLEDVVKKIPSKFLKIHLQLRNTLFTNIQWKQRLNYVLDLHNTYHLLSQAYSSDCRKNLRKIEKADVEYKNDEDFESVIDLYKMAWGPLNPHLQEKHYQLFANACKAAVKHKQIICIHAFKGKTILGRAIFLKSKSYLHYVCAAPTSEGKVFGIMHGIIDHMIRVHADNKLKLDFEGSENESVASFYRKFNPAEQTYLVYKK
jgi:Acetyltransferase (GNAT) domain